MSDEIRAAYVHGLRIGATRHNRAAVANAYRRGGEAERERICALLASNAGIKAIAAALDDDWLAATTAARAVVALIAEGRDGVA